MKKILSTCLALVIVISANFYLTSCAEAKASKIDAVDGILAVDVHDMGWRREFIASLKPLTPAERKARVDQVVPRLNAQLIENLQRAGFNCEITSITYVFGSGDAEGVTSGDGKKYDNAYFVDDLYAVVKGGTCFGDSVMAFVECFNGVFRIKGKDQDVIGDYSPIFTIEKGWGINRYVEYRNSIWLAEVFGLTLHKGQGWDGKVITPKEAYDLYNQLGETAVTVEVYEGDVFNLGNMTYTSKGKVVHAKTD